MPYHYTSTKRERSAYSLPSIETFQLTAIEAAELDEEMVRDYMRRREFRLAGMNSRVRERMLETMVDEEGIKGGWFYWFCFPGCLPEGSAVGPFETEAAALLNARQSSGEDEDEE